MPFYNTNPSSIPTPFAPAKAGAIDVEGVQFGVSILQLEPLQLIIPEAMNLSINTSSFNALQL